MKRAVCFFLLVTMMSVFLSCGSGSAPASSPAETAPADETSAETTEEETTAYDIPEPELPDEALDGRTFTLMYRGPSAYSYRDIYLYTDALNGEVVNDAVFERNTMAEERFNIVIEGRDIPDTAAR